MINLPAWKLTLCPPLYDTSSKSPIEMVAQVYAKMRELVEAHNKYTDELTKAMNEHENNVNGNISSFKNDITCLMNNYIASVDTEMKLMHDHLHELLENYERDVYIKTKEILQESLEEGTLVISEVYDETSESLIFTIGGTV